MLQLLISTVSLNLHSESWPQAYRSVEEEGARQAKGMVDHFMAENPGVDEWVFLPIHPNTQGLIRVVQRAKGHFALLRRLRLRFRRLNRLGDRRGAWPN